MSSWPWQLPGQLSLFGPSHKVPSKLNKTNLKIHISKEQISETEQTHTRHKHAD